MIGPRRALLVNPAASWWNPDGATPGGAGGLCLAAYQAKGAASLAASYVNLARPGTYDLAVLYAAGWSAALGWICGVSQLNTGIDPALDQHLNMTLIMRCSDVAGPTGYCFGSGGIGGQWFMFSPNRLGNKVYWSGTIQMQVAPPVAGGVLALAGAYCYLDGAIVSPIAGNTGEIGQLTIGWANGHAVPFVGNIQAAAVYNASLTPAQVAARSAAMAAL